MLLLAFLSPSLLLLLPLILLLWPYLRNRSLRHVPGPPLARLSSWWLLYQARRGRRYLAVDAAHTKYGPLVRIQPNHVSIADLDALPVVYAHSGGWTKRYVDCCHSTRSPRTSKQVTDRSLPSTATTIQRLSPSLATFSAPAIEQSTPANARSSPTPSAPRPSPSSSNTSSAT